MTSDELRRLAAAKRRIAAARSSAAADLVAIVRSSGGCLDGLPAMVRAAWVGGGGPELAQAVVERQRRFDGTMADLRSAGSDLLAEAHDLIAEARRLEAAASAMEAAPVAVPT